VLAAILNDERFRNGGRDQDYQPRSPRHRHCDGNRLEMDNNFSLQNLLTGLFGEFRVQADN
jgi:hypothetical protein